MKLRPPKPPLRLPKRFGETLQNLDALVAEAERGSRAAADELIEIGCAVCERLDNLRVRNEELIRGLAHDRFDFPIIYTGYRIRNLESLSRARALGLWANAPFTTLEGLRLDDIYEFIVNEAWGKMEDIRSGAVKLAAETPKQRAILKEIEHLNPISRANATEWARAFARYHVDFSGKPKMNRENPFFRLAGPQRDLETRKRRARERLKKKYGREADVLDLDEISRTKYQIRKQRIEAMQVTASEFRNRLSDELARRLARMLKR